MRILIGMVLLFCLGCKNESGKSFEAGAGNYSFLIVAVQDSISKLVVTEKGKELTSLRFDYPIYDLQAGDIDNDGGTDVFVGIIKPTRNDTSQAKRLFIYELKEEQLIPKWLGSRVGQPLEAFRVIEAETKTIVRTIEHEPDGSYLVAEYEWYGFGLSFMKYVNRNLTHEAANQQLNQLP